MTRRASRPIASLETRSQIVIEGRHVSPLGKPKIRQICNEAFSYKFVILYWVLDRLPGRSSTEYSR